MAAGATVDRAEVRTAGLAGARASSYLGLMDGRHPNGMPLLPWQREEVTEQISETPRE